MKKSLTYTILRVLTGLGFVAFGAAKFFPMQAQSLGAAADAFFAGMAASGYFIPFLGIIELLLGLMLLFNFRAALASVMLFPVTLNIVLFNLFLTPTHSIPGIIVFLLNIYLLYSNREKYSVLLKK